jgi:hypothetical protein
VIGVVTCTQITWRFVEHEIDPGYPPVYEIAVYLDARVIRDFRTELLYDDSIHPDPPLTDEQFRFSAGRNTVPCNEFLKAYKGQEISLPLEFIDWR